MAAEGIDVAGLAVEIDPSKAEAGAKRVEKALGDMERAAERAYQNLAAGGKRLGQEVEGAAGSFSRFRSSIMLAGAAMAAIGIARIVRDIIAVNKEFEQLRAGLETVTGSARLGRVAFEDIKKLAVETPFSVKELTEAFIQLRARGMSASNDVLKAYGDMAAAFPGKSITDVVDAVGHAVAGNAKGLQAFGVVMRNEGSKVKLSFKGHTESVKRDAADIEKALIKLAETNFSGSMGRQMDTIQGAFSNLGDALDSLYTAIGEGGLNKAVKEFAKLLTDIATDADGTGKAIGQFLAGALDVFTTSIRGAISAWKDLKAALPESLGGDDGKKHMYGYRKGGKTYNATPGADREELDRVPSGTKLGKGKGLFGSDLDHSSLAPEKVDKVAKALRELHADALAAAEGLGLAIGGDPEDLRGLEIETELLKFRNSLLREGKSLNPAQEAQARADVTAKVDAEAAQKQLEAYRDTLAGLKVDAQGAMDTLTGTAGGMTPKQLAVESKLLDIRKQLEKTKPLSDDQVEELRKWIKAAVDATDATERLNAVRGVLKGADQEIAQKKMLLSLDGEDAKQKAIDADYYERLLGLQAQGITLNTAEADALYSKVTVLHELNDALEEQAKKQQRVQDALGPITSWLEGLNNGWKNFAELGVNALDGLADAFTNFIVDGEADWKAFTKQLEKDLVKLLIKEALFLLVKTIIFSATGGASAAGLGLGGTLLRQAVGLHSGGVVGQDATFTRAVPFGAFAGARRYHSGGWPGLRPDEVPAILQKGERVLSRSEAKRSGDNTYNIHAPLTVVTPNAESFNYSERQNARKHERRVRQAMVGF